MLGFSKRCKPPTTFESQPIAIAVQFIVNIAEATALVREGGGLDSKVDSCRTFIISYLLISLNSMAVRILKQQ